MEHRFIYVFDEAVKDYLIDIGLQLFKEYKENKIFVFLNDGRCIPGLNKFEYVLSNNITF